MNDQLFIKNNRNCHNFKQITYFIINQNQGLNNCNHIFISTIIQSLRNIKQEQNRIIQL